MYVGNTYRQLASSVRFEEQNLGIIPDFLKHTEVAKSCTNGRSNAAGLDATSNDVSGIDLWSRSLKLLLVCQREQEASFDILPRSWYRLRKLSDQVCLKAMIPTTLAYGSVKTVVGCPRSGTPYVSLFTNLNRLFFWWGGLFYDAVKCSGLYSVKLYDK